VVRVVTPSRILIQLGGLGRSERTDGRGLFSWRSRWRLDFVGSLEIIDDRLNDRWWNDGWWNDRWFNNWGWLRFLVHSVFPF
jgi:hypothetical protein